jgi:uroporphyrinogen decarboxylase
MTEKQWKMLLDTIEGKLLDPLPTAFIIDSPWLPNWFGINILDYFTNDELWFKANLKAVEKFPKTIFLPGFWSEYGMCGEPSAFGAKCSFPKNEFPHAHLCIFSIEEIKNIQKPNPLTDGFAPFILNRLKINQGRIKDNGHLIKFSVSRGPLNIANYLMGTSEFLLAMMTYPEKIHFLLRTITDYLVDWHDLQKYTFSSIEGILILDDIIGFIGTEQFVEFGLPYFKEIFNRDVKIKLLHNDANCIPSLPYLNEIGINILNMGFDTDLNEFKKLTHNKITMLGNIPPRDVLANGSPEEIKNSVKNLISKLHDHSRIILSCGGGISPAVSTENLQAFIEAVHS